LGVRKTDVCGGKALKQGLGGQKVCKTGGEKRRRKKRAMSTVDIDEVPNETKSQPALELP